jgi:hypothetical protein
MHCRIMTLKKQEVIAAVTLASKNRDGASDQLFVNTVGYFRRATGSPGKRSDTLVFFSWDLISWLLLKSSYSQQGPFLSTDPALREVGNNVGTRNTVLQCHQAQCCNLLLWSFADPHWPAHTWLHF